MESISAMLSAATFVLVGIATLILALSRKAVETAATEGAKTAIKNINWPTELSQAIQKARGVERQELRFQCYGALWSKLRPLALYGNTPFDKARAQALSTELTDWYFSACGGLLLTSQAREFYFALQDLLREISSIPEDWTVRRSASEQKVLFAEVLKREKLDSAQDTLRYMESAQFGNWLMDAPVKGPAWRTDLKKLAGHWLTLGEDERYAVLQQVGSALRTSLTNDVESRMP
jgi:hypothetical protein